MCKNLVDKGNLASPLIIFNRTTARASDLAASLPSSKTRVVEKLEDAISASDIIFTCLSDDAAVTETLNTAIQSNVKGKLFVDCSTIHPDTTNSLATQLETHGAHFVACPGTSSHLPYPILPNPSHLANKPHSVFGAPAMAESGQLVCVLAGPAPLVARIKPYCKGVMGRAEVDFSDQKPGQATMLKVIGNTFIVNLIETLSEGHTLAEKSGLGTENLHKFIEIMFPGPYAAYSTRMTSGDYHRREEPLFGVELARKDARHALSLAEAAGTRMKALEVADAHLEVVQRHCGKKGDIAGIYGAVRQEAGLRFENGEP